MSANNVPTPEFPAHDSGRVGERQELAAMQGAAPRPNQGASPPPTPRGNVSDPFRPTSRPDEPITAGIPGVGEPTNRFVAKDPDENMWLYWKIHGNPELRALLMRTPR